MAANIVRAFRRFDADGDGSITREELSHVLMELDPVRWNKKTIKTLIKAIDVNGDGCIQYEEFISWAFGEDSLMEAHQDTAAEAIQILEPAVINEPEAGGVAGGRDDGCDDPASDAPPSGCMLIFFDVDGVLNTKHEVDHSDSDEIDEEARLESLSDPLGRWGVRLNRGCLRRLQKLLASFEEPPEEEDGVPGNRTRLVMSSPWRLSEEQASFVEWALRDAGVPDAALVGKTASLSSAVRGEEILHFLAEYATSARQVSAWVSIDDNPEDLKLLGEQNQVETSTLAGLDAATVTKARASLATQDGVWHLARKLPLPEYPMKWKLSEARDARDAQESRQRAPAPRPPPSAPSIAVVAPSRPNTSSNQPKAQSALPSITPTETYGRPPAEVGGMLNKPRSANKQRRQASKDNDDKTQPSPRMRKPRPMSGKK